MEGTGASKVKSINELYEDWYLDYASYVILERAVPNLEDGLKPVQRRILHALYEMEDGRFHKVANVIGQTMQYHPHGDSSIGGAIVNLGQKELLLDTQGNWGDTRTGDSAAAPRYIEVRLSKFALEVGFNPKITQWQLSYDGRKREPVFLPVKFPLLLAQGVDGIAVGLATAILPHNFCELIEASIAYLQGKEFNLLPDFAGGMMDASDYREGLRGGKIKLRATIEEYEKGILVIKDVPYGITTDILMESIVKEVDKGKIKVKKVVDNTAQEVEILIHLAPGASRAMTIDALYAFTKCEVSLSPNACVIVNERPLFLGVNEILRRSTDLTMDLLGQELEIRKGELKEAILFGSLEQIFIDNRIYRDFDNKGESFEEVLNIIDRGLEPHKAKFYREITREDLVKLTEIRIKRISKYDSSKAEELLKSYENELAEVENNIAHLRDFSIRYYQNLLKKYGKGRERKTKITRFDTIYTAAVAANNTKLFVDRENGFVGFGLKKEEFVCDCSDIDDVIVFRNNGMFSVVKISEKVFVGKGIIHVGIFRKGDERTTYNMVYLDGESGRTFVKRFQATSIIRDKEYDLTTGAKGSKLLYFKMQPNGEAEVIQVKLNPASTARIKQFDFDFATLEIKGRQAKGNLLTKYAVKQVKQLTEGVSTLGKLKLWYEPETGKFNTEGRGRNIGNMDVADEVLVAYTTGEYEILPYDINGRLEAEKVMWVGKFSADMVLSAVYFEGDSKTWYVKRFKIETTTRQKKFLFLNEHKFTKLLAVTGTENAFAELSWMGLNKKKNKITLDIAEFEDVKGWKAMGSKLPYLGVTEVLWVEEPADDKPQVDDGQIGLSLSE